MNIKSTVLIALATVATTTAIAVSSSQIPARADRPGTSSSPESVAYVGATGGRLFSNYEQEDLAPFATLPADTRVVILDSAYSELTGGTFYYVSAGGREGWMPALDLR